jgi:glycosyltransferase involved in cell wall biosynthesis
MHSVVFIVPGSIETSTGGYAYDRRVAAGLRHRGWSVAVRELHDSFPHPTPEALRHAADTLAAIPAGATVLVDGLACGAMPAEMLREATRLRLVALVHHPLAAETGLDPGTARRFEERERLALRAARRVVATSRATAAELAGYGVGPDRIAVAEPGTDRAPLARGSRDAATQRWLCVGALIPRKGHETLVAALATIPASGWHLTCVGSLERDPPTVERLRGRLRASGLDGRVTLTGEVVLDELNAHYDATDLFVLPTFHEGYGMAVAEALARGIPIMATATGAIGDLVEDGAGLLVPAGDHRALATALRRFLADAGLRERLRQGARRVRDRLPPWEEAAAEMARVLEQVEADGRVQP